MSVLQPAARRLSGSGNAPSCPVAAAGEPGSPPFLRTTRPCIATYSHWRARDVRPESASGQGQGVRAHLWSRRVEAHPDYDRVWMLAPFWSCAIEIILAGLVTRPDDHAPRRSSRSRMTPSAGTTVGTGRMIIRAISVRCANARYSKQPMMLRFGTGLSQSRSFRYGDRYPSTRRPPSSPTRNSTIAMTNSTWTNEPMV
jgi:hypothetical protein